MNVIVRRPRSLPSFGYQEMAEGARFEASTAPETIGPDLVQSVRSQLLTEALEAGEKPIESDEAR
jgi:hypothetical protein